MSKPDTKMRGCKLGCGARYWCATAGTCPECKAILATIAADQKRLRATVRPPRSPVGAAYTRGRAMSAHLRGTA